MSGLFRGLTKGFVKDEPSNGRVSIKWVHTVDKSVSVYDEHQLEKSTEMTAEEMHGYATPIAPAAPDTTMKEIVDMVAAALVDKAIGKEKERVMEYIEEERQARWKCNIHSTGLPKKRCDQCGTLTPL